jgi:transposase InsO family protein
MASRKRICTASVTPLSRRPLDYAAGARHDAEHVAASRNTAAATRGGDVRGVITHTGRGGEYCARKFERACRRLGVVQPVGRAGSCFDNAVSEAFDSALRGEYGHRLTFRTPTGARIKIATWITGLCNTRRLHSVCGFKSPMTANASTEPPSPRDWPHRSPSRFEGIDAAASPLG